MAYQPIENYGVIGNLKTVALVGINASIDFMCFPDFDSPSIFASMLDAKKGGSFEIAHDLETAKKKQFYLPETNILITRFLYDCAVAEISDFMAIEEDPESNALIRRIKVIRGEVSFHIKCDPRFDYGRAKHKVQGRKGEVLFIPTSKKLPTLRLRANIPYKIVKGAFYATLTLKTGDIQTFVLEKVTKDDETSPSSNPNYPADAFKKTMNYWRAWIGRSQYTGRWREMVNRSALVLKLLTSQKYGSIVASPTFGLPEEIGGVRNWDYRYTWIRDASFTLYSFIRLGFTDEATQFMKWIEDRCEGLGPEKHLQLLYRIDGRNHDLDEVHLTHFEGYRGSSPVRIGNEAYKQLQLDIYGELMDSVYLINKYGNPISIDLWINLTHLINWVEKNWDRKDEGIWELRGGQKKFLYSRLMCWVAIDRGIRLALKRSFPAPIDRWIRTRDKIYLDILKHYWSPKLNSFVQSKGSEALDAATLLMPMVKFIGPTDPRWLSTLQAIKANLVDDSLVHRYKLSDTATDGLSGGEGTFNMCSFWYIECLSRSGDLQKARYVFEKMTGYANHLGLFSEELGPSGEHLGNFPQAFTHLGLISAAFDLDRRLSAN